MDTEGRGIRFCDDDVDRAGKPSRVKPPLTGGLGNTGDRRRDVGDGRLGWPAEHAAPVNQACDIRSHVRRNADLHQHVARHGGRPQFMAAVGEERTGWAGRGLERCG